MKYKTKKWTFDAFEYDPYGLKPAWWLKMIEKGKAHEFKPRNDKGIYYATFEDKRSQHKAFVGDYITRDQFGRIDVYSARNFAARAENFKAPKPHQTPIF